MDLAVVIINAAADPVLQYAEVKTDIGLALLFPFQVGIRILRRRQRLYPLSVGIDETAIPNDADTPGQVRWLRSGDTIARAQLQIIEYPLAAHECLPGYPPSCRYGRKCTPWIFRAPQLTGLFPPHTGHEKVTFVIVI